MQSTKRKGDLVLVVCQHNESNMLEIQAADPALESLIGFTAYELMGRPLSTILTPEINQQIHDYLEFGDEGNDLSAVLSKVRHFALRAKAGFEVPLHIRIFNTTSFDKNPRFLLVMHNASVQREIAGPSGEMRDLLSMPHIRHEATGTVNEEFFHSALTIVKKMIEKGNSKATLAVFEVDKHENLEKKYGPIKSHVVLKEVVDRAHNNFREDDVLGYLGGMCFGVILMEADVENAKIPLNRLRWFVNAKPIAHLDGEPVTVSLTIVVTDIDKKDPELLLEKLRKAVAKAQERGENQIIEI